MSGEVVFRIWQWTWLLAAGGCAGCVLVGWRRDRRRRYRTRELLSVAGAGVAPVAAAASGASGTAGHGKKAGRQSGRPQGPERARSRLPSPASASRLRQWAERHPVREGAAGLGAGVITVILVGGTSGWLAAAVSCYAAWRWTHIRVARMPSASEAEAAEAARTAARQLPLAADLMAACLAAGSGPGRAAEAVGRSVGGPLGARLVRAAAELRLGGEPAVVWGQFGALPGSEGFARCMERAATAGVPAVESVARFAGELRARRLRAATARARRVAVLVTGPLGLCFLPAFLVVGVVPVLLGLAHSMFGVPGATH